MANDKSISRINMEHEAAKRMEARTEARRGTRRFKASETAKAEEFIAEAKEKAVTVTPPEVAPKAPRSTPKVKTYTFTAEELREAREGGSGRSWRDVAKLVGLPNPGAARKAWADLLGESHTNAKPIVSRAKNGATASRTLTTPKWDDTADRQTIVDTLLGATVTIKAGLYGGDSTETINVAKVYRFDDSDPERPAVELLEGVRRYDAKTGEKFLDGKASTGARRTVFLDRIVEVR